MEEILPKNETSLLFDEVDVGSETSVSGASERVAPTIKGRKALSASAYLNAGYYSDFNKTRQQISSLRETLHKVQLDLASEKAKADLQNNRNIEIIGIFSSILALLIVNTTIISKVESFRDAMGLVVALTATLAFFATLVHEFFGTSLSAERTTTARRTRYGSIAALGFLVIVGFISDPPKNVRTESSLKNSSNGSNVSREEVVASPISSSTSIQRYPPEKGPLVQ